MPNGCVLTDNGFEYTRYSCCCNIEKGIYYYMTYNDFEIKSANMNEFNLNCSKLLYSRI